ncbi:MAG: (Fe-S)-binding protein [Desulfomonile tiedjei]|uniref:(Fe-S)-binding protein n=1 Tax=Desulfomonile tiedjei TaxID=2358 RepID=A0A9D6V9E4_9BACT|nr:(Fe-S)-binding protein [Desulfomonile tiedjei]
MCQPLCPTFKATRQEFFAPRGRVQLIRHYLEGELKLTPALEHILMSCILRDACASSCPSGVRIDRLLRNMRVEPAGAVGSGFKKRLLFGLMTGNLLRRGTAILGRVGQILLIASIRASWKMPHAPCRQPAETHRGCAHDSIGGNTNRWKEEHCVIA